MTLDEKYSPLNWNTWEPILKKHNKEEPFTKCDYCEFCMPDMKNKIIVCAATYYGENVESITPEMLKNCDFELSFSIYVDIGESKIEPEFTNYVKRFY